MPEAPVLGGARSSALALDDAVFGVRFNEALVHESVRAERAARRRGTAATRTRGMVSGGGTKPWRQKGTGRARAGSIRSPLWTGGGTVFGPQPRSYTFKVNRRERRAALRGALSLHASRGSLAVIEHQALSEPKTKGAMELLSRWDQDRPTLVVLDTDEAATRLSFRNLVGVSVLGHEEVGVTDVVGAASMLISRPALDALTARAVDSKPARAAQTTETAAGKPAAANKPKQAPAAQAARSEEPADETSDEQAPEQEAQAAEVPAAEAAEVEIEAAEQPEEDAANGEAPEDEGSGA